MAPIDDLLRSIGRQLNMLVSVALVPQVFSEVSKVFCKGLRSLLIQWIGKPCLQSLRIADEIVKHRSGSRLVGTQGHPSQNTVSIAVFSVPFFQFS